MFSWAIRAALECQSIDKVYVSTHFEDAFEVIKNFFNYEDHNVYHIPRPIELHGNCELLEVMKHALQHTEGEMDGESKVDDIYIQIQVNKPLTTKIDLYKFINRFKVNKLDSLFQIQEIKTAIVGTYKASRSEGQRKFKSCAMAKIWTKQALASAKSGTYGQGEKHEDLVVPNWHTEIDTMADFDIAEVLLRSGINAHG